MLEPAVVASLARCRSILLAGAGGGYDVLGAVPLLLELRGAGKVVHLASLTFSRFDSLSTSALDSTTAHLGSVTGDTAATDRYCPEAWLSDWLRSSLDYVQPVWLLDKTGVEPMRIAYQRLVEKLSLDAVVLVDGGIDVLLRGDETSLGTPGEDLTSLCAVSKISCPVKLVACLGMGSELRDGIRHARFLERVAQLSQIGGFLGTASLSLLTEAGRAYEDAVEHVLSKQAGLRQSHVQRVVLGAMRGVFGSIAEHTWLSPLLPLYWFFDLPAVAATHLFLPLLEGTKTAWEVSAIIEGFRNTAPTRPPSTIPI